MANFSISIRENGLWKGEKLSKDKLVEFKGLSFTEFCNKIESLVKEVKTTVDVSTTRGTLIFYCQYAPNSITGVWYKWPSESKLKRFIHSF